MERSKKERRDLAECAGSSHLRRNAILVAAVGSLVALSVRPASAAPKKWDGGASGSGTVWTTGSNWVDDVVPDTSSDVIFDNSSITGGGVIVPKVGLNGASSANSLQFGSAAGTPLAAFTLASQSSSSGSNTLSLTTGNVTVDSTVTGTQSLGNAGNGTLTLDTAASGFTFTNNSAAQTLLITTGFTAGKSVTMSTSGGAVTMDVQRSASTLAWLASTSSATGITNGAASGNIVVTLNGTGSHSFAGSINDGATATVGLTLSNASLVQTLTGDSNYSGGTIITAGQLNIASGTALGTGAITVGGTIDNTTSGDLTLSNNNAVNWANNATTFAATHNLNFGSGPVNWSQNGQTFNLNGNGSVLTFGGTVTSTSSAGGNVMTANGPGNTLVIGGLTSNTRAGSRIFTIGGTGNVTVSGTISDGGASTGVSLALASGGSAPETGLVLLQGTNTYTGTTSVGTSGTLQALIPASLPGRNTTSSISVSAGGSLVVNAGGSGEWTTADIDNLLSKVFFSGSGAIFGIDTTHATSDVTYASDITSPKPFQLAKMGTHTLILTGNDTFLTKTTFINGGTLQLGNGGTTGTLGAGPVVDNANLTINHSDSFTFGNNAISGIGSFTQAGAGTTTLNRVETYTGPTNVTAGILNLNSGGSLANSNINITGGTLSAGTGTGGGTINYNINNDTADLISLSDTGVLDLRNIKFNLVLSGTQTQKEYVLANHDVGSAFVIGTQFASTTLPSPSWSIDYDGTALHPGDIVLAVPEPSSLGLLGVAMIGLCARRRRRQENTCH